MRLLLIADIHSNLEALQEALREKHDRLICLGDIVGYGPNPKECVDLMREKADVCLMGNHDAAVCGKTGTEWFNTDAAKAIEWTKLEFDKKRTDYLRGLPETYETRDFFCVHGSPANHLFEYILTREQADAHWPAVLDTETMRLEIKRVDYPVSETVKKIRSTELPASNAERLLSGT